MVYLTALDSSECIALNDRKIKQWIGKDMKVSSSSRTEVELLEQFQVGQYTVLV